MLTPTTVGGLKQSLKCVLRWGLHHQCPENMVVCVTEQAYQHLISLNTLQELSQFQCWTIFILSLTSGLVHVKNYFSRSILGIISVGNRRPCNCVQCGDESGGAIWCRPSKCVFSQWWDPQLVHKVEMWRERSWFKFTSFNSLLNIDQNL